MKVIGYTRVSTQEQVTGLDAQTAVVEQEAERRGWDDVRWVREHASAKDLKRPGLQEALAALQSGEVQALVVAKLDRLSRSVVDFAGLVERSRAEGWSLIVLDIGVDTTTPHGELVANMLAAVAQWERRLIGQRTKEALAVKREQGVRLGRPPLLSQEVREWAREARAQGLTYEAIACELNAQGVSTARGGQWRAQAVRQTCVAVSC